MEERLMPERDFATNNLLCPKCKSTIGYKHKNGGWSYYPRISRHNWKCKCGQALVCGKDRK